MLKQLPALTRYYTLRPADVDDMTLREISEYLVFMQTHPPEEV